MFKSTRAIMILLIPALFLGACFPAAQQSENPSAQNTQSLEDVQSQVSTSVAQTIEAQNQIGTFVAQTVEAQASPTFTATPFTIPTFTPFVIPTATLRASGGGSSGGGGGGSGSGGGNKGAWDCAVVSQTPRDGDRIWKPNENFDVVWTIKNNGTKELPADIAIVPFVRAGETNMSITPSYILGHVVPPGDTFTFIVEITAPPATTLDKEQYTMSWAVVMNGTKLCTPYISIFVQRR